MGNINLADVKLDYEGQTLPAINLLNRLQIQIKETAYLLAAIADTLGELQAALLNQTTVEVKLTLPKEDWTRFRALDGDDDSERVRRAVLSLIARGPVAEADRLPPGEPKAAPGEAPEERDRGASTEKPLAPRHPSQSASALCPTCHSIIWLPKIPKGQWSLEVKCESCGAKSILNQFAG